MDILLVDDDAIAVMMLRHALAPTGHTIRVARSGSEALARFGEHPCRLVISDWLMPGMDGVTLCRRMREMHSAPYVYFMLLTSWPRDLDIVEGLSAGADDILVKPFDPAELRVRIRNAERILNLEELAAAQHALEERDARLLEYTHSLEAANEDLRQTKSQLERKNERLNALYQMAQKFVDNVSHEFRTPVTVVGEYASLIAEGVVGPVTSEQRRFLEIISERADDLNTIVDDMLDGSRLDAGMLSVIRRPHQIREIVEHVRPVLERKAAARQVALAFQVEDELPDIYADAEKVGRIIINLVINAIKFCGEPGMVHVVVRREEGGPGVTVSIADNGLGIDVEKQEEIFDRFKQLGSKSTGISKGFGLGLSIVKELVDLNLGHLQLKSRSGSGTEFLVTLPPADQQTVVRRYMQYLRRSGHEGSRLTLSLATVEERAEAAPADGLDEFLCRALQHCDLLVRTAPCQWAIISPAADSEYDRMVARLTTALDEYNRNCPGEKLPPVQYRLQGTWPVSQAEAHVVSLLEAAAEAAGRERRQGTTDGRTSSAFPTPRLADRYETAGSR